MQSRPDLPSTSVNDQLLRFTLETPPWFWVAAAVLALAVMAGLACVGLIVVFGLQLLGYTHVQQWSVLITHLIFWVGISETGVMISAILRLSQAEWRRPVTRAAEVLAIFALITAALFPIIHTGRMWRTAYWFAPYDFVRDIWPNVRSVLVWDASAIQTYLTATVLFVYVDLIPDLAVARERTHGWRRACYGVLSLGFRGTTREWKLQRVGGLMLSALILPVFVSVHSTVAWDFGVVLLPGWHTTILAPYFVVGAIHSGVAGVVTVMYALRRLLHLEPFIRREHFEIVGRIQIIVALGWLFFSLSDFFFALVGADPLEVRLWELRLFEAPWNVLFAVFFLTVFVIPFPLLLLQRIRSSPATMFWLSIGINIGMWLERYILVVTPLTVKQPFVFTWLDSYTPQPVEYVLSISFLALVALGLLLFARVFPIVPIWEVKEGQIVSQRIKIGRARVPAAIQE
ncbi:MAG: NrfD/PsrC family molybdoenzyme membrane anchor subunit [Chloroflexota bacterium]